MSLSLAAKGRYKVGHHCLFTSCSLQCICLIFLMVEQKIAPPDVGSTRKYLLPPACRELAQFPKQSPSREQKGKAGEWHSRESVVFMLWYQGFMGWNHHCCQTKGDIVKLSSCVSDLSSTHILIPFLSRDAVRELISFCHIWKSGPEDCRL